MARLIRTEKEVEGRFEEVWLVVEEDALDQWPAGPGTVVGRDATRKDAGELFWESRHFLTLYAKVARLYCADET